jgi:hypothetical protein
MSVFQLLCQPPRRFSLSDQGRRGASGPRFLVILVLLASAVSTASAQVGHPPGASPYHDIRKGHTFTVLGGYFSGSGGDFGIGPHSGNIFGARYDIRTASALQIGLGFAHAGLERFIVDPFVTLANRKTGPVDQTVTFAELSLQMNVTGGKSWHRLAPFFGGNVGLAFATTTPGDTSQYKFGRKFYVAPVLGTRFFITDRLHLRAEARATFWKLNYPTTFQQEPPLEPGNGTTSNAVIPPPGKLTEWTTSSWLQIGLGYSFSP